MKELLHTHLLHAWQQLCAEGLLGDAVADRIEVSTPRDAQHGDYASNLALVLAHDAEVAPRELAEKIRDALPPCEDIAAIEIAGPGFINFYLHDRAKGAVVDRILKEAERYGRAEADSRGHILIEYVSANPTGPLHIGHGRGAALGSCLAHLLKAAGYTVSCEYFINDAGRQMDILALSVWLRYLELCGEEFSFPPTAYQGDYILDIAADVHREDGDRWRKDAALLPPVPAEADAQDDYLDSLIQQARDDLGEEAWERIRTAACDTLLERIRHDLESFGASFDSWRSERELQQSGQVDAVLEQLQQAGHTYEQDGAIWFRSSDFGDEKDRVIRRANGQWTYFATDLAYHAEKFSRGFAQALNLWGADHHGYAARLHGAIDALGEDRERLEIRLIQFASLHRGGKKLPMSTRGGRFVTLQTLQQEIGTDAARFFYMMRGSAQHLDFDLELATRQSADNPVYYVQYAHARICRVLERVAAQASEETACDLSVLREDGEQRLQKQLAQYPDIVQHAAQEREPHHLTHYLRDLAGSFHAYYNATTVLVDDSGLRQARLRLIRAVRHVLRNGLELLGINAPESM